MKAARVSRPIVHLAMQFPRPTLCSLFPALPSFLPPLCSLVFALCMLSLESCSPDQHPKDIARIDTLRTQAEQLIKAQSLMGWNSWVHGSPSNQDSLYKANAGLFTMQNIDLVKRAESEEPDSVQKKRLRYFKRYLTTEYIAKEIAPLTDKVSNIEASATVAVDGKQIPYRQVSALMANEKKQARRATLYSAVDPVLDTLNIVLAQVEQTNQRLARELGFSSYNAMVQELKEIDLEEFKRECEQILETSEATYETLLNEILTTQLKLDLNRFYRYDTAPLFRSERFDRYFLQDSMTALLHRTYDGIGINLLEQTNLKIDSEVRETKNPRAVCYPIDVPNDVRLSIKPIGGADDYLALFHEIGHGLHYANTGEHAFEFKYLGEPTVTETYAFLSEYLLANQSWLRLHSRMPTPILKEFVRFQAFHRLYFIRRYCAKFLYEMQLHSGGPNISATYAQLLSQALGYQRTPSDEKRYLTDVDPLYYSAGYLRAWFLEAQLNATLTEDFGVNWFEHLQAGVKLKNLWARGDRLNGDELARFLGYDRISPNALLAEVNSMMLFSTR